MYVYMCAEFTVPLVIAIALYNTSMCTCPVVQGVGRVAKCMLMCMHGYYTIYMISYMPLWSPVCLHIVPYVYLVS